MVKQDMSAECDVYDKGTTVQYIESFSNNPSRLLVLPTLRKFLSKSQPGQRILDLGCGPGAEATITEEFGLSYNGVDLSPEMISICRDKGLSSTVVGDLGDLPFADNSFDKAISLWAMQYKANPEDVSKEWARVLKSGGDVFIVVPHPLYKFVKYSRDYFTSGAKWEEGLGIRRFNYYHKLSDYFNALVSAGFAIKEVQETQRIGEKKTYYGISKENFPHDLLMICELQK